jgi:tetratricopeptide (TPR) repeat protein
MQTTFVKTLGQKFLLGGLLGGVLCLAVFLALATTSFADNNPVSDFTTAGHWALWASVFSLVGGIGVIVVFRRKTVVVNFGLPLLSFSLATIVFFVASLVLAPILHNHWGKQYSDKQLYSEAIFHYQKASDEANKTQLPETYLLLAEQQTAKQEFEAAVNSYEAVLNLPVAPSHLYVKETAKYQLPKAKFAWANQLSGDLLGFERVVSLYDDVIAISSDNQLKEEAQNGATQVIYRAAQTKIADGQYDAAIGLYEDVYRKYNSEIGTYQAKLSSAYLLWGQDHLSKKNYQAALATLEPRLISIATLQDKPAYYSAIIGSYYQLGNGFLQQRDFKKVIDTLENKLSTYSEADSSNLLRTLVLDAYTKQADLHETRNEFALAVENYEAALGHANTINAPTTGLYDKLVQTYRLGGSNFQREDNFDRADYYYQQAFKYASITGDITLQSEINSLIQTNIKVRDDVAQMHAHITDGGQATTDQNYPLAIESYQKALATADNLNKYEIGSLIKLRLADNHKLYGQQLEAQQNNEGAIIQYEVALTYYEMLNGKDVEIIDVSARLTGILAEEQELLDTEIARQEQEARDAEAELNAVLLDVGLTGCSFVPFVGIGCDIAAVGTSVARGDWVGVGLSLVAVVPFFGDFLGGSAKAAKVTATASRIASKIATITESMNTIRKTLTTRATSLAKIVSRTPKLKWAGKIDYSALRSPVAVGAREEFTAAQKRLILQENMRRNGGVVRSDSTGEILTPPSLRGEAYNPNGWSIDHFCPRKEGGSNSFANARVISILENSRKNDLLLPEAVAYCGLK